MRYTMRREMRTTRVILNKPGTLTDRVRTNVKVLFDLVETQDIVDGVPDLEFAYGNLRFEDELNSHVLVLTHSRKPVVLEGGGIQTTILLLGPHAFTVMSVVKEIHVCDEDIAA